MENIKKKIKKEKEALKLSSVQAEGGPASDQAGREQAPKLTKGASLKKFSEYDSNHRWLRPAFPGCLPLDRGSRTSHKVLRTNESRSRLVEPR